MSKIGHWSLALAMIGLWLAPAWGADPEKKKKRREAAAKSVGAEYRGIVKGIADDGKLITVAPMPQKGNGDSVTRDIKVNKDTQIDFSGLTPSVVSGESTASKEKPGAKAKPNAKEKPKLEAGQMIEVTFVNDNPDLAKTIKVHNAPPLDPERKKKKKKPAATT